MSGFPAVAQGGIEREIAQRVGLTPPQARQLFARVDRVQGQVDAFARANGLQARMLRAIALELGARNPALGEEQFIEAIRDLAGKAAEARTRIAALEASIAMLDPGGDRARAETLLAQARSAFDEGRLEDAETAFGALSFIRANEMATARQIWIEAIDLQAQSAALRGDTERAETIRRGKIAELRQFRAEVARADREEEWLTLFAIAYDWYERGDKLGDNAALVRSIETYRNEVLPAAPRESVPLDWAATQNDLGNALWTLGGREGDTAHLEEAVAAYQLALEEQTRDRVPLDWARSSLNLSDVLLLLAVAVGEADQLDTASMLAQEARAEALQGGHQPLVDYADRILSRIEQARSLLAEAP